MTDVPILARPLPFRLIIDEAIRLGRPHFKTVLLGIGIPMGLALALPVVGQTVLFSTFTSGPGPSGGFRAASGPLLMFLGMGVAMLVQATGTSALMAVATDAAAGRPVRVGRSWAFVFKPRVFLTTLTVGVAAVLGLMCCIAPGLYVMLIQGFVCPVMLEEGLRGGAAMSRSSDLTSYNPRGELDQDPRLKVFLVIFVGWLVGSAAGMAVSLPLVLLQQFVMFREMAAGQNVEPGALMARVAWLQVPSNVVGGMLRAAVHLFTSCGLALLYFDTKARKEGVDLAAAVERIIAARRRPSA